MGYQSPAPLFSPKGHYYSLVSRYRWSFSLPSAIALLFPIPEDREDREGSQGDLTQLLGMSHRGQTNMKKPEHPHPHVAFL